MSEENVELVRRMFSQWERGNFWNAEYFDPDVRARWFNPIVAPPGGETQGTEALAGNMREALREWEGMTATLDRIVDLGERVLTVEIWRARGKASGIETQLSAGSIWTVSGGRITRIVGYDDPAKALEAAGVSE